ncbi:MAG: hypothetical protein KR126chlam6_00234 [Candidatus Anoxychlamydiales bacterium]|nr:hypothetical protein [Candidatus Anoxychlamydiales bacterium]
MKKLIYIVTILCIGFIKVYSNDNSQSNYADYNQNNFAYNFLPKMLNNRSYNFYAFGEFLYMQASQDGLEYALLNSSLDPGVINPIFPIIPGKRIGFDDDWSYEPGVKIGLGYIDKDLWNANLYYTYVDIDSSSSINFTNFGILYPIWFPPSDANSLRSSKDMKAKWSGSVNSLDFKIGKKIYLSKKVLFEPNIGIKVARIKQLYQFSMFAKWSIALPFREAKFDGNITFKGAGIRAGIDSEYHFLKHLYLFGNLTGSILHSKFNLFQKYNGFLTNTQTPHTVEQTDKIFTNIPCVEVLAGIAGNYSYKESFQVELKIGYEMQTWFRQNQFVRYFNGEIPTGTSDILGDDLTINGLSIRLGTQF